MPGGPDFNLHSKSKVPEGIIKLRKRLVSLKNLTGGGIHITFNDGSETTADLVVGGDGIRWVSFIPHHINTG